MIFLENSFKEKVYEDVKWKSSLEYYKITLMVRKLLAKQLLMKDNNSEISIPRIRRLNNIVTNKT
jgi:hypothetical protein